MIAPQGWETIVGKNTKTKSFWKRATNPRFWTLVGVIIGCIGLGAAIPVLWQGPSAWVSWLGLWIWDLLTTGYSAALGPMLAFVFGFAALGFVLGAVLARPDKLPASAHEQDDDAPSFVNMFGVELEWRNVQGPHHASVTDIRILCPPCQMELWQDSRGRHYCARCGQLYKEVPEDPKLVEAHILGYLRRRDRFINFLREMHAARRK